MNAQSTDGAFPLSNVSYMDDELYVPTTSHSYWSFGSYADPHGIIALSFVVRGIVLPVMAFIGIVANALNMVVLSKVKKLKRVPLYDILLSMTAADFSIALFNFVVCGLLSMGPSPIMGHKLNDHNLNKVKYYIFAEMVKITEFFIFISHWSTTSVAAFRFIAVYFPLRAAQWCTPRLTRATIVCTIIAAFLVFPLLGNLIDFVPVFGYFAYEFNIFYATIVTLFPWTLSVVLVSLLLASLRSRPANGLATEQRRDRLRSEHRQLTVILTFTAAWFVVTTAPIAMINLIFNFGYRYSSDTEVQLARWWQAGQLMLMLNYCGNFFFYSWINKCHRKKLRELISSCKRVEKFRLIRLVVQQRDTTAPTSG